MAFNLLTSQLFKKIPKFGTTNFTRLFSANPEGLKRAGYDWLDPILMKDQLEEEELMVYETAMSYAKESLMPRVLEANRNETFDATIMKEMGELGLLGCTLDGYGCAGVGYVTYGLVAKAIEGCDSGYRSAMSVQSSLVMFPIHAYGTEEQKQKVSG